VIFYHRTRAARKILREGFRDSVRFIGGLKLRGIWLSDFPLDCNEGAKGNELLEITLPDSCEVSHYELIEEGKPYREWCIPARTIQKVGSIRLLSDEEEHHPPRHWDKLNWPSKEEA